MKPFSDSGTLQGGVFKLKIVPENIKLESLQMTQTSALSDDESDVSSMNLSAVSVEAPTLTTSMPNRKPLSQVRVHREDIRIIIGYKLYRIMPVDKIVV